MHPKDTTTGRFLPDPRSVEERFWDKVNKSENCWVWTAYIDTRYGYGKFTPIRGASPIQAHRFSYQLTYGPIPYGMLVCHHCDVPKCVRPDHLFLGTHADNSADMVKKGRQAKGSNSPVCLYPEKYPRGETHHKAKLTVKQVFEIREKYKQNVFGCHRLAQEYGVDRANIRRIIQRKIWKQVP